METRPQSVHGLRPQVFFGLLPSADRCLAKNEYFGPILACVELMKQVGVFSRHRYGQALGKR